jgi:hypothetical protein
MAFEGRHQPLASRASFVRRMALAVLFALGIDLLTLIFGAVGYHLTEGLGWIDALLDAALVMTGNGPLVAVHSVAGKLFTIADALGGGVAFVVVAGVLLMPVLHRVLHRFNLDPELDGG